MRLGVHLPQYGVEVTGDDVARAARDAERAGADDVWVSDHVVLPAGSTRPPESFHDALTVLTWAAAATRRVGLGTSVLVMPYRDPVVLARAVATLDALSGGRVVLGVASGWMREEFRALGIPFGERGRRTDRGIAVCRALWAGEDASGAGGPGLRGMRVAPGPARRGGPPVWIGGDSDAGIRRAARLGDAWHTTTHPGRLGPRVAALRRAVVAAGRDPAGVPVSVRIRADVDRARELIAQLRRAGVAHVLVDLPHRDPARVGDDTRVLRRIVDGADG